MAPFQIHSATTSHGSIGLNGDLGYHQHVWQSRMESSILFQHQLMRKKLAVSYVAAGDFGSPDIRLPMPGNFWWVRSDHVVALPNLRGSTEWSNCWNAEHWIGRNGMNEFDLFDYGERDLEGFHLASTGGLAAGVTTNRHNGCFLQGALVPRKWRYNRLISAHAPATISIEVKIPITLYGILSDTGDPNHGHWLAEFKVNDVSLATLDDTIRKTREITLSSGLHELEIDRIRNRHHAGSTFTDESLGWTTFHNCGMVHPCQRLTVGLWITGQANISGFSPFGE